MAGHSRRQDLLGRPHGSGVDPFERRRVDRVVDGAAHAEVVERRLLGVHPEVEVADRRFGAELRPLVLLFDFGDPVRRGRRLHPVGLARLDVVHLGGGVGDDLDSNRVDVAAGQIRHRLRVGRGPDRVAVVVPAATGIGIGDLIGAGRRRRVRGLVAVGRAARKQGHVEEAELVAERAPRLLQVDHDPARPVVGVDSGDAALAGLGEPFGADDVRVEGRAGGAGPEEAFDDEGEVRGADRAAVGVLEARAQEERVPPPAPGDLRQAPGQGGNQLRAGGAVRVGVGEQRKVGVLHRRPAFRGDRERRVQRVGEGRVGAAEDSGAAVRGAAAGDGQAGGEREPGKGEEGSFHRHRRSTLSTESGSGRARTGQSASSMRAGQRRGRKS